MTDFTLRKDADGVAIIEWDVPEKSMNVLSLDGLAELDGHLDAALADDAVKGIVITSAKPDFAGGMDLNVIAKMKESAGDDPARGLFDGIMQMHAILRKIERGGMDDKNKGGKPVAAALPGTALGIGLEIPLACHRIFAADSEVHLVSANLHLSDRDPFKLFARLLDTSPSNVDPGHAFYLGFEMAKAAIALALDKQYRQDEALDWGYLTVAEERHRLQRGSATEE